MLGELIVIYVLTSVAKIGKSIENFGKREVPDVRGIQIDDARKILEESGFKVYTKGIKPSFFMKKKLNEVTSQPFHVNKDEMVILEYYSESNL